MSAQETMAGFMAGSLLFSLFLLAVSVAAIVFWVIALVHCIKNRHDKDRMLWVIIVLLGGPLGAMLYWTMGQQKNGNPPAMPNSRSAGAVLQPPPLNPHFDHAAIHDEKKRSVAISDALGRDAAMRRR